MRSILSRGEIAVKVVHISEWILQFLAYLNKKDHMAN